MLLSIAFFPPVSWLAAVAEGFTLSHDEVKPSCVWLEACESYRKQSYRNRFLIAAAGGVEPISFPVVHGGSDPEKEGIREVRVDWSYPWLERAERALESAYLTSAYFYYYRDELFSILESRPETLWDLDMAVISFLLEKTGILADFRLTAEYDRQVPESMGPDLRDVIHPKRPNNVLEELGLKKPYFQVFARKYGFVSDLSSADLLFNEGPDSIMFLKKL
jgi:hypothetical protein